MAMTTHTTRLKWWQVYLTLPLLIVLFLLNSRLKISERGHQAVQIGIILLVYGLIHLWVKANQAALAEYSQYRGTVIISRPHVYKLANAYNENDPMYQLQDPEIKGTLSNTFEMEIIDAEFFSVDEVSQELNKE
jgi:hypothetical protein